MSNELNVNVVLEELKTEDVKDYQLCDIIRGVVRDNISGLFVNDTELIITDTVVNSIKATNDNLTRMYSSIENACIHHMFDSFNHYIWQRDDKKDVMNFRVTDSGKNEMLYLMEYAITGHMRSDKGGNVNAYNLLEDANISTIWNDAGKVEVLGATVQFYKNNNCKVTGLTDEQKDRIRSGFATFDKYRNVR